MFKATTLYSCILILLFSINGCSTQSPKIWFQSTSALIEQENYKKALEQLTAENKQQQSLYKRIEKLDQKKSIHLVKQINLSIKRQHWGQAKKDLQRLKEHHVWNAKFDHLTKKISQASANEYRLIQTQYALAQANLLQAKLSQDDFNQRNLASTPSWSINRMMISTEKNELATTLYRLSIEALAQQDYENAHKTYSQALELNSELQKDKLSQSISAGINKPNQNTILDKQRALLKALNKALSNNNFKKIISLQGILSNAPFKGQAVNAALKRSSKIRLKQATLLDKQADSVYRHGKVANAIQLWKQAKTLAPALTDLQEKLARAKKVQNKLVKLRRKNDQ